MRQILRTLAQKLLPGPLFQQISAIRSRRWQLKFLKENGSLDLVKNYVEQRGTTVESGPFRGMRYPVQSALSRWSIPKLTGTYESEIHPFLTECCSRKYDMVIDIGSAEGYYAVGLAMNLGIPVYAYDTEPREKGFTAEMAALNEVTDLVVAANLFTSEDIDRFTDKRVLCISDCEGFESVLFSEGTVGLTKRWDMIIELHAASDDVLPHLPWPQRTSIIHAQAKAGMANEYRHLPQRFLICDSQVNAHAGVQAGN